MENVDQQVSSSHSISMSTFSNSQTKYIQHSACWHWPEFHQKTSCMSRQTSCTRSDAQPSRCKCSWNDRLPVSAGHLQCSTACGTTCQFQNNTAQDYKEHQRNNNNPLVSNSKQKGNHALSIRSSEIAEESMRPGDNFP